MAKGILKYSLLVLAGGWMFVLGVLVGRGTSPVTFDTASLQERLRVIVGEIEPQAQEEEKVALDFYKALNTPVHHEVVLPANDGIAAAVPDKKDKIESPGKVPLKLSLKKATFKGKAAALAEAPEPKAQKKAVPAKAAATAKEKAEPAKASPRVREEKAQNRYTIQVAAYKAFKDAVTQMSLLKEKGFASYRTKGEKDGQTWYRVRTGSFADYKTAQAELEKLKQARVDGMIIKKDEQ